MFNILKSSVSLGEYTLLQTSMNKVVIFKCFYKYTRCIYINKVKDNFEVSVEKVFDNKYLHNNIERMFIDNKKFSDISSSVNYIQQNIKY